MKRLDLYLLYVVSVTVLYFAAYGFPTINHTPHKHPVVHATPQQLASHKVTFFKDFVDEATCTGTAIGPHAFLTGTHCDPEAKATHVRLDLSHERHEIIASHDDGHDHTIYIVDGTALKNIAQVQQASVIATGDIETLYGVGGGEYPPVPKYGHVTDCNDPSDMDQAQGEVCSDISVIPGDSGSAVWNNKGEVVGLATYRDESVDPPGMVSFTLDFSPEDWALAVNFSDEDLQVWQAQQAIKEFIKQMLAKEQKE